MIVALLITNFVMAENGSEVTPPVMENQTVNTGVASTGGNQFSKITGSSGSQITQSDFDNTIDEACTQVSNFAELVLRQVADKSTPICALLLIYGAVLYFIMGIRNLYRKRQGMLMMWGSLTFWVIAQVAYVVFWLLGTKL